MTSCPIFFSFFLPSPSLQGCFHIASRRRLGDKCPLCVCHPSSGIVCSFDSCSQVTGLVWPFPLPSVRWPPPLLPVVIPALVVCIPSGPRFSSSPRLQGIAPPDRTEAVNEKGVGGQRLTPRNSFFFFYSLGSCVLKVVYVLLPLSPTVFSFEIGSCSNFLFFPNVIALGKWHLICFSSPHPLYLASETRGREFRTSWIRCPH